MVKPSIHNMFDSRLSLEAEIRVAEFQLSVIRAKVINRRECLKARLLRPGDFEMTPQEQLFADFFNDEAKVIDGLSDLELRMHREELAKIAFEAKARLTKVDEEERSRKAKSKKTTGILASVEMDDLSSDAINKIQARQKKLNKADKLIKGLIEMGMSQVEAEAMLQAGTVLGRMRQLGDVKPVNESDSVKTGNPFASLIKANEAAEPTTEVIITDETTTVVVTKTENEDKPFNPFKGLVK